MACQGCEERREMLINAVLEGRIAAAAGHMLKGAAEIVGLKVITTTVDTDVIQPDGKVETVTQEVDPELARKPKRAKRS